MRIRYTLAVAALAAAICSPPRAAADEDLSIVVNPRTGTASIRNDSQAPLEIDGYLLRAGSPVFDSAGWNSFEEQGISGWVDGPSAANRLGDTNLFGSLSIDPGQSLPIGAPYAPFTPTEIGQPEPTFNFSYNVPGVGSFDGDVEFSLQNTLVLVVNPATGAATLENQSAFDIDIDSYLIRSEAGVLSTAGWSPLASSVGGWTAAAGASNRLAEGNLFGSTFLAADGGSLSLGSPIDFNMLEDESDLSLEFRVPGLGTLAGGVLFTSAPVVDLPGDYNGDGQVNAADYTVWRDGASPDSSPAGYQLWADNYGSSASGGAAAASVPEPHAVCLLALALTAGASRRR
ncbi:hypothetical protein [Botrimarina sp.]|uniref:hypothetical protein n=1 Tax=Botrimarina sp. TaxID=2795802 RepID=UPI0032EEBDFF